jgi:tetratricopeptide (TPR) repeat protein
MTQRLTPWNGLAQTLKQLSAHFPQRDDSAEEAQLYYRRACLAASEERHDVAMVFIGKALNLDPRNLPTRLLLAQIYDLGLRDVEAAIRGYKKVIALSGYDSTNPYCAAARESLDRLISRATAIPVAQAAGASSR